MTEDTKVSNVTSSRGAQWAGAGSLIALAAGSLLGGNGINLGGIFGNNAAAQAAHAAAQEISAQKDAKIAKLEGEIFTRDTTQKFYEYWVGVDKQNQNKFSDLDKRVTVVETSMPLREKITEQKIATAVATLNGTDAALAQQLACCQNTLNGIVKHVVPNSSVCPGWGPVTIKPEETT